MKTASKHIVFIATRLDLPGGIEKAITATANLLIDNGYVVSMVIADETNTSFYPLDKKIQIIHLNVNFGIQTTGSSLTRKIKMTRDILALRRSFKNINTDYIIATEYHLSVVTILAGLHNKSNVWSWEHHHINALKKNIFWRKMVDYSYPKLSGIICLNDEEKQLFSGLNKNVITIPNFTPIQDNIYKNDDHKLKKILTVARLSYTKGIDRLLEIAKHVLSTKLNVVWKIIGEGELTALVINFIKENNFQDRFILQSPVSNDLSEEYKAADIFVLTSRYECFPMTLLEAMSFSVPCIAFDCNTGPRHIIRNQLNGLLAKNGDIKQMSDLIIRLLSDDNYHKELADQALSDSRSFSPEHIYLLWNRLLN